jgi:hypothetical protein
MNAEAKEITKWMWTTLTNRSAGGCQPRDPSDVGGQAFLDFSISMLLLLLVSVLFMLVFVLPLLLLTPLASFSFSLVPPHKQA